MVRALSESDPGLARTLVAQRYRGVKLQFGMRVALVLFLVATLALTPPAPYTTQCALVVLAYAGWCGALAFWAARDDMGPVRRGWLLLVVDASALSAITLVAGRSADHTWTSDILVYGFFLIPIVAAAQVRPLVCGWVCAATELAFVVSSSVNRVPNGEPWRSVILHSLVLAALSAGCVALSFIQRWRLITIAALASERSALLQELLGLERRERSDLAERLHDGALQYVLAARQDLTELIETHPDASVMATLDRLDLAMTEAGALLRSTVAQLHPAVLEGAGLPAALRDLATDLERRTDVAVEIDVPGSWVSSGSDPLLYSAARELLTNVGKHARAAHARVLLIGRGAANGSGQVALVIADDGCGMSDDREQKVARGHIGLASLGIRVAAAGGSVSVSTAHGRGTEVVVSLPAAPA
jgi:two-component system NarL family sensor kinase